MSRKKVYEFLKKVPENRVTTYKELADAAGTHQRAVAVYMKTNDDPVNIPCFRVINSDGSLGGYSGKEGISGKVRLLEKHGIEVRKGKIDDRFIHRFKS